MAMTDQTIHHDGVAVRAPRPGEVAAARALMIRIIERDYGYPYASRWHADLDDVRGFYLDHPRHLLLVAVEEASGQIVGTCGVRVLAITSPPHPPALLARYTRARSAELTRVFVAPEARRRGLGRLLVAAACRWVAAVGGFDVICFHSRTAIEFWRSLGSVEVLDARRPGVAGPEGGSVYFEIPVPPRSPALG